ncbi:LysR substrate-binding domain-containing protein [Hoeflea prorocentri]|uniref:LysR substrate-binding domain-containing protein n=1 Tax=Hoeflea prorocentri TaxID=1922333 RepID=A0A9X3UM22_9HYPH|nr:LysR substrate-binding domain-containing protein [Hoeflea prorocentri]MCY6381679.1 LysR substrate-binding domain-containing protein [Hoeflea prorocentri]MDA5399479.1 LysR substrate-binding domain-containing protein [Hoeflea prorocentri]
MDRLQTLEVFVAVAEAESFIGGARAVGLSAPSATRGINALEARLGARLFTRTTRRVRLTDIGQAYLEDARRVLADLKMAEDAAMGAAASPVGEIRLTCPNEFGRMHVMPVLTAFLDAYPDMTAHVLTVDRIVNLVEEGFDVAVRIGSLPSSGLSAVRVGHVRRVLCGAPAYFETYGMPRSPADLQNHRLVSVSADAPVNEWRFGRRMDKPVKIRSRLTVNSIAAALAVARNGWGLTRALSYQVSPDLASGELKTVLTEFEPEELPIHLVHIEGRRAVAKVRTFIDFAAERLRANPVFN